MCPLPCGLPMEWVVAQAHGNSHQFLVSTNHLGCSRSPACHSTMYKQTNSAKCTLQILENTTLTHQTPFYSNQWKFEERNILKKYSTQPQFNVINSGIHIHVILAQIEALPANQNSRQQAPAFWPHMHQPANKGCLSWSFSALLSETHELVLTMVTIFYQPQIQWQTLVSQSTLSPILCKL